MAFIKLSSLLLTMIVLLSLNLIFSNDRVKSKSELILFWTIAIAYKLKGKRVHKRAVQVIRNNTTNTHFL
jgi:hypothetical protein